MNKIAVSCKDITKTYGSGNTEVKALRGINLDIFYGEILLLVGPSGCGKTTLISIIATLLNQNSGSCTVLGKSTKDMNDLESAELRCNSLGFVFQSFNLLPALNSIENISIPLLLNGIPRYKAEKKSLETLKMIGFEERAKSLPKEMSGGQQQKIAMARALVHDPELIICDEPTSNLDYKSGQDIMSLLKNKVKKANRSIIVVTHDQRIYKFADRIALMEDGRIIEVLEGQEKESLK